ncbi:unnamed protein product [Gadus morhua 'NCC']
MASSPLRPNVQHFLHSASAGGVLSAQPATQHRSRSTRPDTRAVEETQQVHPDVNPPQRGTLSLMKGAADTSHRLTVCSLGCGAWLRRMEQRAAHLQGRRVITHVQTQNRH